MVGGASSREALTVEAEGRACAERTANIPSMSVTLDVSRLSGWLNTDAYCRIKKRSIRRRGDMRAVAGGVGWSRYKQRAGKPRLWGLRAGQVRSAPPTLQTCTSCL